jgi:hypothetical protein
MDDTESIPELACRLAELIEVKKGKSCALIVVFGSDDDYNRSPPDQIVDGGVRVLPGYDVELLNPPKR